MSCHVTIGYVVVSYAMLFISLDATLHNRKCVSYRGRLDQMVQILSQVVHVSAAGPGEVDTQPARVRKDVRPMRKCRVRGDQE